VFEKVSFGRKVGGTDHQQEFADFLLEDYDQGDQTNVHKTPDHAAYHFHLKQFGEFPQGPYDDDPDEYIDGHGALDQFVNVVEQGGHKDDVNDIRHLEFEKV